MQEQKQPGVLEVLRLGGSERHNCDAYFLLTNQRTSQLCSS